MSVAHDGESNLSIGGSFTNTATLSSKTTVGSDRCAIVHVGWLSGTGDEVQISALTYGGGSILANLIKSQQDPDDPAYRANLYYVLAPATSASDVVITFNDDAVFVFGCSSYNGVHQTTPVRTGSDEGQELDSAAPSLTVDPTASGDVVVDCCFGDMAAPTQNGGQTQIFSLLTHVGSDWAGGASYKAAVGATTSMGWSTTAAEGAYVTASLQPSGAPASVGLLFQQHYN